MIRNIVMGSNWTPTNWNYWIATLDGDYVVEALDVATDSSNNIYVVGRTWIADGTDIHCFIVKFDSSGTISWQKVIDDASGYSIFIDGSDNIFISGRTGGSSGVGLIMKLNTSGTVVWQRTLGTTPSLFQSVHVDSSGNILVCGFYTPSSTYTLLSKFNSSGTLQWSRGLESASDTQYLSGVTTDASNNIYACGHTTIDGQGGNDLLVVKYDSTGSLQWQKLLGTTNSDVSNSIEVDSLGNVYVVGYFYNSGSGGNYTLICKYNSSGTLQWKVSFSNNNGIAYGIHLDGSNNIYVIGGTSGLNVVCLNSSGSIQWQTMLDRSAGGNVSGRAIYLDSSGELVIVGYSDTSSQMILSRLPNDGSLTGTYGSFVYSTTAYSNTNESMTSSDPSLTDSAASVSASTSSMSLTSGSLLYALTGIQEA